MDLGLAGKRALVIGASRGLGAAVAQRLVGEGATVVAAARSLPPIEAWRARLETETAARVEPATVDLAKPESVELLATDLLAQAGVDILVNNCGGPPLARALDVDDTMWVDWFRTMAIATFHLTRSLVPPMIDRRWGRVITIGSSGIVQPIANLALSNGVRASVAAWSKTLAAEVGGHGITVNMVLPGRIDTERVASLDTNRARRENVPVEDVQRRSIAEIPVGRYGHPDEFAAVVAFLAGVPAAYVTGSMIRVDGGLIRSI
jgi:3-oxoacyl-[acyl-carrier protein] reductase